MFKVKKNYRKQRTTTLDDRLYSKIRILSVQMGVKVNVLLEEGMAMVLAKHGIKDPREG